MLKAKLNPHDLTLEQVKIVKKNLSQQRMVLNQRIEFIKAKIEKFVSIIENLKLVGSDTEDLQLQIQDLHVQGEKASSEMQATEKKISKIHDLKDRMLKLPNFIDQ